MPRTGAHRRRPSDRGVTLIEVAVTVGVVMLLMGASVMSMRKDYLSFSTAVQRLLGDVRLARMDARTRGAHYRLTLASGAYVVARLADPDGDGLWSPDPNRQPRTVRLPASVTVAVSGQTGVGPDGTGVEFDTRGMLVFRNVPPAVVRFSLTDSGSGRRKTIAVWPSGQVEVERG